MLAGQGAGQRAGDEPVDDLCLVQVAGPAEQLDDGALDRQRARAAVAQLAGRDPPNQLRFAGRGVGAVGSLVQIPSTSLTKISRAAP